MSDLEEEWDLDIEITISIDSEDHRSHEYNINSKKSFEEIKNKIVNGIPLNNKIVFAAYLFPDAAYPVYTSIMYLTYVYFPVGAEGEDTPEYIMFEIESIGYGVTLILNPDGTVEDDT